MRDYLSIMDLALVMPFVGLFGTCLAIPSIRRKAAQHGIVACRYGTPRNSRPIPALGGVAIFLPFAVVTLAYLLFKVLGVIAAAHPKSSEVASLLVASSLMLILGTFDDKFHLSWGSKLLGQILCVLVLIVGGHPAGVSTLGGLGAVESKTWECVLFAVTVISVTNAVNLSDGIDGLAGGICFGVAVTYSIVALGTRDPCTALMTLTLSGSLLGFLIYNFPPASILMGDGGSLMTGFVLVTLASSFPPVSGGWPHGAGSIVLGPVLMFGIPLSDMGLAILRRRIKGQSIFVRDEAHLHHRLFRWFGHNLPVLAVFYVLSTGLNTAVLAIAFQGSPPPVGLAAAAAAQLLLLGLVASIRYNLSRIQWSHNPVVSPDPVAGQRDRHERGFS